jgi:hypothetical protein
MRGPRAAGDVPGPALEGDVGVSLDDERALAPGHQRLASSQKIQGLGGQFAIVRVLDDRRDGVRRAVAGRVKALGAFDQRRPGRESQAAVALGDDGVGDVEQETGAARLDERF